jgi:hypothetical protein
MAKRDSQGDHLMPDAGPLPVQTDDLMAEAVSSPLAAADERRRTADRVFRGALVFNCALTAYWLFLLATGGSSLFFQDYRADVKHLGAQHSFISCSTSWCGALSGWESRPSY